MWITYHSTQPTISGCQTGMTASVDRRDTFLSGVLELTRKKLTLYGHNGHDKLWSVPVGQIASCSKGWLRKSLVVKRRVNIEQNYAIYLAEQQAEPDALLRRAQNYRRLAEEKRVKKEQEPERVRRDIQDMVRSAKSLESKAERVLQEIKKLQTDDEYAQKVKWEKADIVKETLRLSSARSTKYTKAEEYQIWSYMIRRRMAGPSSVGIYSAPPEALVEINGDVLGRTPLVIERPLAESAALKGRYDILLEMDGFRPKALRLSAAPTPGHKNIRVRLDASDARDVAYDKALERKATVLPSGRIDLTGQISELETVGTDGILALYRNRIRLISHDRKRLLLEIPIDDVTEARLEKKLMRGIRGITVSFRDGEVTGLEYLFVLRDAGYRETRIMQRRCEAIVDRLSGHDVPSA